MKIFNINYALRSTLKEPHVHIWETILNLNL